MGKHLSAATIGPYLFQEREIVQIRPIPQRVQFNWLNWTDEASAATLYN